MKYLNTKPLNIFTLFYKALFVSFLFCGIFYSQNSSASYASNLCLHPLEEAALLYGNQGEDIEGLIEQKDSQIKLEEERVNDLQEKINDEIDDLSNSLNDTNTNLTHTINKETNINTESIANLISNYMEEKQDELDNTMFSDVTDYGNTEEYKFAWHNRKYFRKRGQIKDTFCKDFAKDIKDCNRALDRLARRWEQIHKLYERIDVKEDELEELRDKAFDIEMGDESTEANAVCLECVDAIRELNRPSPGQVAGSIFSLVAGGAMSYYGYKAGQRSVNRSNIIREQQGFAPLSSAGASWTGATLGLPFIANGIHGLSQRNSQIGNYNCSGGSFSPHAYGPHPNAGFHANFGPGGAYPNAGFHTNFGPGGPYANFVHGGPYLNAGVYTNFGPGGGPYANFGPGGPYLNAGFHTNFGPGGGPYANFGPGGPYLNAGFHTNFGPGGGPYANFGPGGPYPNAGFHTNFGPGGGGFQAQLALQQQQQQQQQYTAYLQFQQQQMEARIQAQQAWQQQQQALQQDRMHRQQVITSLSQEMNKIQQQIRMVAAGGSLPSLASATTSTTFTPSTSFIGGGGATAPQPQQAITSPTNSSNTDTPIINSR